MAYKNKEDQVAYRKAHREDHRRYMIQYNQKNKERLLIVGREAKVRLRQERRDWLYEVKSQFKCVVCGESRTPCLDFHHKDPKSKNFEINKAVGKSIPKEKVLKELAKCIVLCSNCHRLLHAGLIEIPTKSL